MSSISKADVSRTPIRVRGRRKYEDADKSAFRRRRPASQRSTNADSSKLVTGGQRKLKRRQTPEIQLSNLESLPVELVQLIFQYSINPDLPLASPALAAMLARTKHLQTQFATDALSPFIINQDRGTERSTLRIARRVMNSRFFTFAFFKKWLRILPTKLGKIHNPEDPSDSPDAVFWTTFIPAQMLPPLKLMRGPFTKDKIDFLYVFGRGISNIHEIDPIFAEVAVAGMKEAIQEREARAVWKFLRLGVRVDTELLRMAVVDAGCDRSVVRDFLLGVQVSREHSNVDLLDPEIWSWAERAQSNGDPNGKWLIQELRAAEDFRSGKIVLRSLYS